VDDARVTEPAVAGEPATAVTESMPAVAGESAATITGSMPILGERCAQCAAPLAPDQRYCLQCGEPRPHIGGRPPGKSVSEKPPPVPPPIPGTSPGRASPPNNSLALIAGVGVLLLAMGVGVLIGRAGVGSTKTPPAQVISLGSGGGAATTTTSTPLTTTPEAPAAASKKKAPKTKESSATGASLSKPAPPSAAQNLRSGGSGQSYEQKSKALPNVVSTG
jgi:hypothetical protein